MPTGMHLALPPWWPLKHEIPLLPQWPPPQWSLLSLLLADVLSLLQILDLVAVNCTDHRDIRKLEATILEHVKNEELFPEVVRVLPPVYREVEAAIVGITQSEEMADHGERFLIPHLTAFLGGTGPLRSFFVWWWALLLKVLQEKSLPLPGSV